MGLAGHVHGAVGHDGGAVDRGAEVGLAQDLRLGPALGGQHHEVAVFVTDIHLAVGHQGRAPHVGLHVVHPVQLSGLGVEAVHEAGEVADEEQARGRIDAHAGDRALDALVVPQDTGLGEVALLGGVEAHQAAHALTVLGILTRGHVHAVLVEDRSGVDFAGTFGGRIFVSLARLVGLVLGRVEVSPEHLLEVVGVLVFVTVERRTGQNGDDLGAVTLLRLGVEGVYHAVATTEEHEVLAAHLAGGGRGPLAVENPRANAHVVFTDQLAGLGVERDEARGRRRRDVDVGPVLAVGGTNVEDAVDHEHRAVGGVVREHTQLIHHVVAPQDVGILLGGIDRRGLLRRVLGHVLGLVGVGALVAIGHAFRVEAEHLAATGDDPKAIAHHQR